MGGVNYFRKIEKSEAGALSKYATKDLYIYYDSYLDVEYLIFLVHNKKGTEITEHVATDMVILGLPVAVIKDDHFIIQNDEHYTSQYPDFAKKYKRCFTKRYMKYDGHDLTEFAASIRSLLNENVERERRISNKPMPAMLK